MTVQTKLSTEMSIKKIDGNQFLALEEDEVAKLDEEAKQIPFKTAIVWKNVLMFIGWHIGGLFGLYLLIAGYPKWQTCVWLSILMYYSNFGIAAGAHRLWCHRSYKATLPLRIFLMIGNCIAVQNDIIEWVRDHRCHHKWTDTNADPHSTKRGFFFAHMGWLLVKKHPQIKTQGAKLDLSDLYEDPVCVWQRNNYIPSVILFAFVLPTFVPVYFWNESVFVAFPVCALYRLLFTLHATWCVNSVSHW
ncbi:hypothetical protein WR25_17422 [Diploscapter pachys]|uniref:Fatty acid desaturase domain-containing protein n=1 Tax=Diploscapter pachys TaxID=2018661 RepID=A0A2A2KU71_9BILA|nr:hypothetical protein WR25_17422 [Diploscapter pachys]